MCNDRKDTKSAIGSAALALFAQRGYPAVSVRDIAERVGIRPSAIYNHFQGKQNILVTLMEGHMRQLLEAIAAIRPASGDPHARLEAFVRFHIGYHLDQRDDVFIAYMELRSLEPANFERMRQLRRDYENVLRAILADGCAAGIFRLADARVEAMSLISMLTGVTTWFRDDGRLGKEDVADIHVGMALRCVGAA